MYMRRRWSWRPISQPAALLATVLSMFLTATMSLTMAYPFDDLLTIALHYPVFLLIAWVVVQEIPRKWWAALYIAAIPLVLIELVVLGLYKQPYPTL